MKILTLSVACLTLLAAPAAEAGARSPDAALDKADADHDGYVTREELRSARSGQFQRLDRNGDGVVTLSEFPRLARSKRSKAEALKALIRRADRDGDGRVTRTEFVDGPSALFDRADRDQDGRLSRDESADIRAQLEDLR